MICRYVFDQMTKKREQKATPSLKGSREAEMMKEGIEGRMNGEWRFYIWVTLKERKNPTMVSNYEHLPGGRNGEALKVKAQMQCANINLSRQGGRQLPHQLTNVMKRHLYRASKRQGSSFLMYFISFTLFLGFSYFFSLSVPALYQLVLSCFPEDPRSH